MSLNIVGIAEAKVTRDPSDVLVTYALGSCIAVAIYDPLILAGGLLHFMLPDSALDAPGARERPCKFADSGVRWLLNALALQGARRERLRLWIAGGAQVQGDSRLFQVGRKNHIAVRELIDQEELPLDGEDVGGSRVRTMGLEMQSGICWVESLDAAAGTRNRLAWRAK